MEGSIRVAIADDDADIRQLVHINLELDPRFAVVGEASDGLETISLIRHTDPDVALVDLDMPRLGGLEAIRRIRAIRPDVIVLVFSASGHDGSVPEALDAGAHGHLDKVMDITRVANKIAAYQDSRFRPVATSA